MDESQAFDASGIPSVQARIVPGRGVYAHTSAIIVDRCPYCGFSHRHHLGEDDVLVREADCFQGQYKLIL